MTFLSSLFVGAMTNSLGRLLSTKATLQVRYEKRREPTWKCCKPNASDMTFLTGNPNERVGLAFRRHSRRNQSLLRVHRKILVKYRLLPQIP